MPQPLGESHVESQPLLGGYQPDNNHHDDTEQDLQDIENGSDATPHTHPWKRPLCSFQVSRPGTIILLLSTMMFSVTTSGMMILVPLFRLMEDALCHVYYNKDPSEPIEEKLCKVDGVQGELAYLGGWATMLGSVIGMLAALPYGVLADRIGRRKVFALSYLGIVLSFGYGPLLLWFGKAPTLWLILFGCLFQLLGGGVPVAMNSLNAMAVDVSPDGDKSTGLLYLSAGAVGGALTGPVVSGLLMTISPWLPIIIVICLTPFVFGMILILPETLPLKLKAHSDISPEGSVFSATTKSIKEGARELGVAFRLLKDTNLLLTMVNFFIQPAIFAAYATTLVQHVSTYFGWTLAQTSYRLSPPLGLLHLSILVLLPRLTAVLTSDSGHFRLTTFSKDVLLTKISLIFLIIGAVVEGFSQSVALFIAGLTIGTFGAANGPLCRAVSSAYVESDHTSRLYALISMLETSGSLIGGPVLAVCFNIGLSRGGLWKGLPWFYVAILVFVAYATLMFVREPKKRGVLSEEEENEGLGYQSAEDRV